MAATGAGRKPKPPQLKLLEGMGNGRDSGGRKVPEPKNLVRATPQKPETLSKHAEWLWDKVIEQLETVGLLKPLDGPGLEVMCETFARWREAVEWRAEHGLIGRNSQGAVVGQWVTIESQAAKDFRSWASEFGFTPAAERNLLEVSGGGDSSDANPFS